MSTGPKDDLSITFLLIFFIAFLLLEILIYRNRGVQPIRSCGPWLISFVLITATFINCLILFEWLEALDLTGRVCKVYSWLQPILYPALLLPYFLRVYRLYHLFNNENANDPMYKSWFTERHLLKIYIVSIILLSLFRLLQYIIIPYSDECEQGTYSKEYVFWIVFHALILIVLCLTWKRFCDNVRDEFSMTIEFKCIISFWLIAWILDLMILICQHSTAFRGVILDVIGEDSSATITSEQYWQVTSALDLCRTLPCVVVTCVWPLIVSQQDHPFVIWSNVDNLCSLKRVLSDPIALRFLRQFCAEIHEAEYLIFWVEVEIFRENSTNGRFLLKHAHRIYESYLKHGNTFKSRFGHLIRPIRDTLRRYKRDDTLIRRDLFNRLQRAIFQRLETRVFPRFLSSTKGRQCFEALLLESDLQLALIRSEMIDDHAPQLFSRPHRHGMLQ